MKIVHDIVSIVFCFDRHYAAFATVATLSVAQNAITPIKIYWIIFEDDLPACKSYQSMLQAQGVEVRIFSVSPDTFAGWPKSARFTHAVYLRFLIPKLICEDKAIYLDSDVLVVKDLSKLFETELNNCYIAGAIDPGDAASLIPRAETDPYLNSGVMLMNLKMMRQAQFEQKIRQLAEQWGGRATYPDQCLINKFAEDRKLVIASRWNRLVHSHDGDATYFSGSQTHTAVFHYFDKLKPWKFYRRSAGANLWWSYADKLDLSELRAHKTSLLRGWLNDRVDDFLEGQRVRKANRARKPRDIF